MHPPKLKATRIIKHASEATTLLLGKQLAAWATPPLCIFLHGELGAGKTTFVRGFLRFFDPHCIVKSPTYTIVESYQPVNHKTDLTLYHFDCYRIHNPHMLDFIGIRDYFNHHSIQLIEWPEKGKLCLPDPNLSITLTAQTDNVDCRTILFQGYTDSTADYLINHLTS